MGNTIENGYMIFGYLAIMLENDQPWDPQTVYHHNRAVPDEHRNWWVSKKSTAEAPNLNHPIPGFDANGDPVESEWWALWIDWQHPMARLEAAVAAAVAAAADASEKAGEAQAAAEAASSTDVSDHERRIVAIETALGSVTHGDIETLASKVSALEGLVDADVDGVINKFNEVVAAFAGVDDTDTVEAIVQRLSAAIAAKQDAGDYATNERVNELEAKVGRYCSPHFESDELVFPAESTAYFDDDVLVLTQ
ncbi:MAG: hypothetical protein IJ868_00495 [Prevotella sp.]|nr:hypothetical protein [Prevotella sp.]